MVVKPPVVLLTDFGWSSYVGVMKGVILSLCPGAQIIDLTHDVGPQNVREGAWLLLTSYRFFPLGSIFVAVVDPGVGTARQPLALRAGDYYFVGPDNGLLFPAVSEAGFVAAVALPVPATASATFHGRDVFAPAAARLAAGVPLSELGPATTPKEELAFRLRDREGEVVTVDRFGNLITNLPPMPGREDYRVTLARGCESYFQATLPFYPVYAAAPPAVPFLITGSSDTLEISVRNGSAARLLQAASGDLVIAE